MQIQQKPTEPSVNHCQGLPSALWSISKSPLLFNLKADFWFGILNGMEHLYVPFVHIIYTGQWCHSFYDCVTFFFLLYIPRRMACHWHGDLQAFSLQWQSFRRACWHLANTLEEENKSWHFIGFKREGEREKSWGTGRKGEEKERKRDSVSLLYIFQLCQLSRGPC